jgi:hypothetical protein
LGALDDVAEGVRFLSRVPAFLHHAITPEQARGILQARLARRDDDFLDIARRMIYPNERSPYAQLLAHAGCEYGDLERLVHQDGLEGALGTLYRSGVYLTIDEFRARRPVERGSLRLDVSPRQLRNPSARPTVGFESGGSRGTGTPMPLDLAHKWDRSVNACLLLDVRGGNRGLHAIWKVPGSSGLNDLLENGVIRAHTVRWFSQVDPRASGLHPRYRWSARALRWGSILAGVPLPAPEYVPIEDPTPIVDWLTSTLRSGGTPHLRTYVSQAVRICEAAQASGVSLEGVEFTVSGEPITAARLAAIRRPGAEAAASYGASEAGNIGKGCLAPATADDLHFYRDLHAVVQPGSDSSSTSASVLPPHALLLTSLRASSRFILLNVSMGDQARVSERACGCPLEQLGWTTHLCDIRSFEKLTAGGMTFLDTDVARVLEETLPNRFGGGPTDFQLVDDEAPDGRPCLRLLAHPRLGPLDDEALREAFLDGIAPGAETERVMGQVWRDGDFVRVERAAPMASSAGKILHVRSAAAARAGAADAED